MPDRADFIQKFVALDALIDAFTLSLPAIESTASSPAALTRLITHTFSRAATIKLRSAFGAEEPLRDHKDVAAARAAVSLLDHVNFVGCLQVDPILAVSRPF